MTKNRKVLIAAAVVVVGSVIYLLAGNGGNGSAGGYGSGAPPPVIVYTVVTDEFVERLEAIGTLLANESVTLTARVTETVTKVNFDDGQFVEKGQVLLEFTNEEESAQLSEANANHTEARKQLERIAELVQRGSATRARLDEQTRTTQAARARVQAIEARLADRLLKAPFSGVLGFRRVSPGALVAPGTPIATLDDISLVKLDFSVPETYLAALTPGLSVTAKSVAFPDNIFSGEITAIDSRVDPVSRAVTVRAVMANEERLLRPGMLMIVDLVKERRLSVMVPEGALVPRQRKQFVLVIGDGNIIEQREIIIGTRRLGAVEVRSGLEVGEQVVVEGTTRAIPGRPVRVQGFQTLAGQPSGKTGSPEGVSDGPL